MSNDLFTTATRKKFRFNSPQGPLSVEDLWDLPLTSTRPNTADLDTIAISLDKQVKETGSTTSFVKKTTKTNEEARMKFDIVLHVIQVKQEEAEAAATKRETAEKKQKIMEILAQKQDASLAEKSVEELTALLQAM